MTEIWKKIEENKNYEISNMGNVRRITGNIHYMRPYMDDSGYLKVTLYDSGQKQNYSIHRLVANAFIENPDNLPQVNHKNHIRTDNRVDNLEWCDSKYNARYSLAKPIIGYNGKIAVIFNAIADVKLIGLSPQNISACLNGRSQKAYNLKWRYITKQQFDELQNNPKVRSYGDNGQHTN